MRMRKHAPNAAEPQARRQKRSRKRVILTKNHDIITEMFKEIERSLTGFTDFGCIATRILRDNIC
jgi:hypothetical protein